MDKYVCSVIVPDFNMITGRKIIAQNIWKCIEQNKGSTLCVYGSPGCGKTFIIKKLLGSRFSESDTIIKFEKTNSTTPIVIKHPTSDIIEFLKVNDSFNNSTTILICENIKKIDFCDCFEVPLFTTEEINTLFPGYPYAAQQCEGNMWNFEFYKQFRNKKDKFWSPRDYVYNIMTTKHDSYIKESIDEYGHTFGMLHENYMDTQGLDIQECVDISDSMSLADIYDTMIYTDSWNYCTFFQIEGIARPADIIYGRFQKNTIRPGSCWTKMNNHKMRASRLKRFKPVCHQKLIMMLDNLIESHGKENPYNLTTIDVDTINHLKMSQRYKPSEILRLKKSLSSSRATSSKG